MRSPHLGWAALGLVVFLACGSGDATRRGPDYGTYPARGVVEDVDAGTGQVLVDHEDIPGLMPAMTMNFDVGDQALLETLAPGQRIEFELEYGKKGYRILSATVVGTGAGSRGARLGLQGAARDEQPAPDFALVDQDGEPLALEDLRGRVLLVDFVYTHCPGPCPILTGLHVEALRALPDAVRDRVHFVSISLDPARDTPEALRRYAEARGADDPHWSFLTGEPEVVADVLARWGVGSTPGENGEIEHLVASFLVDPEGVIVKRYLGLDHEPAEIASDLEKAAS